MADSLQILRKQSPFLNRNPDALEVVASDETVDRYGDIIRASGWELQNYRQNPIVLFAHDDKAPIGSAAVRVEGRQLLSTIKLADKGTSPTVDFYRAMIEQGHLRAVSVGFMPTKAPAPILDKDRNVVGYEFQGQELLEQSIVSVPANPAALALAKSFNLQAAAVLPRAPDESATAFITRRSLEVHLLRLRGGASARRDSLSQRTGAIAQ